MNWFLYDKDLRHEKVTNSAIWTNLGLQIEATTGAVLLKKVFWKILQNSLENTCARISFLIKLQASGLEQVFSCEFYEICKNTCFT